MLGDAFVLHPSPFALRPLGGIFFLLQTIAGSAAFYYLCSAKGSKGLKDLKDPKDPKDFKDLKKEKNK